jgi:hypothetical protein
MLIVATDYPNRGGEDRGEQNWQKAKSLSLSHLYLETIRYYRKRVRYHYYGNVENEIIRYKTHRQRSNYHNNIFETINMLNPRTTNWTSDLTHLVQPGTENKYKTLVPVKMIPSDILLSTSTIAIQPALLISIIQKTKSVCWI